MSEQDTVEAVETENADVTLAADELSKEITADPGENVEGNAGRTEEPEKTVDGEDGGETGPVKYDFTRPWTISSKFHGNMASIAEAFATQLSFSMSSYLRSTVDVTFQSVRQVLFQDYIDQLPERKCIGVFSVEPLRGQSVITIDGRVMFVILDKLIGGEGTLHEVDRDFTEIETKIFSLVTGKMLGDLKDAAKKFFNATINLSRIENNPAFIAIMTGGEKVIVISLEMAVGEHKGNVLIAMPMIGFDPVMSALDPKDEALLGKSEIPAEDTAKIHSALAESSVEVVAELGSTRLTLDDLLALEVGDTVVLTHRMNEAIPVRVGKTTVCYGEPGRSQNRKAVRVVTTF